MEDLTGKQFNEWTVIYYAGRCKYMCRCSCGKEKLVNATHLRKGYSKECGHSRRKDSIPDDITGMEFGEWTVLSRENGSQWKCRCSCGKESTIGRYSLTSGHSKSCGHNTARLKDETGNRYGKLTVISYAGNALWNCKCDCGNETVVDGKMLRCGNTSSCGKCVRKNYRKDLSGNKYGEWEVIEYAGDSMWKCKCSCGTYRNVLGYSLTHAKSLNCGSSSHKIKDITGNRYGKLVAEMYIGDGKWNCLCDCGNRENVLGVNLRNGSTNSCGCDTSSLLKNTLMEKYGETSTARLSNPRGIEKISILENKDKLIKYIDNYFELNNETVTLVRLAKMLDISEATLKSYLSDYDICNMVKYGSEAITNRYEEEISDMFPGCALHDKNILHGKELDLLYKNKRVAIEFNGNYWHNECQKGVYYHQDKTIECAKAGISLIHIFEYEWLNSDTKNKLISLIKRRLYGCDRVEYARKTYVTEVNGVIANDFLVKYHLQNGLRSRVYLGIYSKENNELLGVMSFGSPRFNSEYEYELHRLVWKDSVSVVGGAEKLFKYFKDNYNPKSIVTYCNISKFTGNVYTRLGFKSIEITKPNYVWYKNNTDIVSRYKAQKSELLKNGYGTPEMTEYEIMESLGYNRIYDSGNLRLEWHH